MALAQRNTFSNQHRLEGAYLEAKFCWGEVPPLSKGRDFCLIHTKVLHVLSGALSERVRKLIKKKLSLHLQDSNGKNECSENTSVWSQNRKRHYRSLGTPSMWNLKAGRETRSASYRLTVNLKALSQRFLTSGVN